MTKVALLGAGGYIGKSLIPYLKEESEKYDLLLFSRNPAKLANFASNNVKIYHWHDFHSVDCDVIINATGVGDPREVALEPFNVFAITEAVDNEVITKLKTKPACIYINLSSGAIYGNNFTEPITRDTKATYSVNQLTTRDYYALAKLHAEAKHRALTNLNIIDLRIFAFFSSFVDTKASFLMSDITNSLLKKTVFITSESDIVRDYIIPPDLFQAIGRLINSPITNTALDIYSKSPISKLELLEYLKLNYGLRVSFSMKKAESDLLTKNIYFSLDHTASEFGYIPEYNSLDGICFELDKLLNTAPN